LTSCADFPSAAGAVASLDCVTGAAALNFDLPVDNKEVVADAFVSEYVLLDVATFSGFPSDFPQLYSAWPYPGFPPALLVCFQLNPLSLADAWFPQKLSWKFVLKWARKSGDRLCLPLPWQSSSYNEAVQVQ